MNSQYIQGTQLLEGVPLSSWREALIGALFYEKKGELEVILLAKDPNLHYGINIDWAADILEPNATLGHLIISKPEQILVVLEDALLEMERTVMEGHKRQDEMLFKPNLHARLYGFGSNLETVHRATIPRANDVGKLVSLSGTVIRTGILKMLQARKKYKCLKCSKAFYCDADRSQFNTIPKPTRCLAASKQEESQGNWSCPGTKFIPSPTDDSDNVCYRDYQEITVQERADKLSMRSMPRAIAVLLENDLVDKCQAGDDVTLTGIVIQRWRALYQGSRCDVELAIWANHVAVKNEEKASVVVTDVHRRAFAKFWEVHSTCPLAGRNKILASICPQMYGLYLVKLAVALVLAGGVPQRGKSGTKVRGESHLLLVGDPGTGKSQFLQFAAKVVPRSVLTTGFGSTNAGLTVSAVRDSGEWVLEAGALVLADRGLCCIDEFGSIRGSDRTAIHEAMEQQSLSVAKAGLVCKLNTQCSIIAATNPKGRYDPSQSLSVNLALASPLLSRFDIVLVLLDTQNDEWDERVSSFILEGESNSTKMAPTSSAENWDLSEATPWTLKQLKAYVALIKSELAPALTPQAQLVLTKYYTMQRQMDARNEARTTIRLLESLVRLSQAHARLTFQNEATVRDAVVAIWLVDASMQTASVSGAVDGGAALQSQFPDDPESEYINLESLILTNLGLNSLVTPAKVSHEKLAVFGAPGDECPSIIQGQIGCIPSQPSTFHEQFSSNAENPQDEETASLNSPRKTEFLDFDLLIDNDLTESSFQDNATHNPDHDNAQRQLFSERSVSKDKFYASSAAAKNDDKFNSSVKVNQHLSSCKASDIQDKFPARYESGDLDLLNKTEQLLVESDSRPAFQSSGNISKVNGKNDDLALKENNAANTGTSIQIEISSFLEAKLLSNQTKTLLEQQSDDEFDLLESKDFDFF